ncbi:ribosomal protein L1p/L10e family-domain-containing protein [Cristinia sonorae]|uniref:Ribosomal L1 domain-containing protein 1 n=1 Tax=Cristinia sonorae TaxID=1940300 RepID=A0A8K0XKY0_9AGAR|nr:ribosomal protein L1p/L10e family-domain-containing protein [Cristinia sonorae]
MAKKTIVPELIDEHVSVEQSQRALDALLKHVAKHREAKAETQLFEGKEQNVWLLLTVKQMQPEKKLKPAKLPIVHPLVDPRESSICLITKDPQREYKDLLEKHSIKFISRVVGVEKLKGKFKGFEEKRMLLKENGMFLADERVVPLLPKLLGKAFFKAKKQPIPVCLTRKDLKGELERAISSTYFHQNQGTCSSIKIGSPSHSAAQILANLKSALPAVIKHIKGGWDNIQSLHIKTSSSASLPIWTCDLGSDEGGRWDGLVAADVEMSGSESGTESDESEMEVDEAKEDSDAEEEAKVTKKGKKRAAEEDEAPASKKKAKSDAEATDKDAKKSKPASARKSAAVDTPSTQTAAKKSKAEKVPETQATSATLDTAPKDISGSAKPSKKKRRGSTAAETTVETPASTSKAASIPIPSTPAPATPASTKKSKASRSLAADFFDSTPVSAATSSAPPPPNTPADGLLADTPAPSGKKKRKGKGVEATPVAAALEKLAVEEAEATPSKSNEDSGTQKRPRKKAAAAAADVKASESVAAVGSTELTTKEIKQKRSAASGEKKKEKVVKGKPTGQTAKEVLIGGKKGLRA